jgi:hypothetical protein
MHNPKPVLAPNGPNPPVCTSTSSPSARTTSITNRPTGTSTRSPGAASIALTAACSEPSCSTPIPDTSHRLKEAAASSHCRGSHLTNAHCRRSLAGGDARSVPRSSNGAQGAMPRPLTGEQVRLQGAGSSPAFMVVRAWKGADFVAAWVAIAVIRTWAPAALGCRSPGDTSAGGGRRTRLYVSERVRPRNPRPRSRTRSRDRPSGR